MVPLQSDEHNALKEVSVSLDELHEARTGLFKIEAQSDVSLCQEWELRMEIDHSTLVR